LLFPPPRFEPTAPASPGTASRQYYRLSYGC
jgi:hypothetical protein